MLYMLPVVSSPPPLDVSGDYFALGKKLL